MSKASEFVSRKPPGLSISGPVHLQGWVDEDGGARITKTYALSGVASEIMLAPEHALAVGEWLVATYGEASVSESPRP